MIVYELVAGGLLVLGMVGEVWLAFRERNRLRREVAAQALELATYRGEWADFAWPR